jgi:regulation of enolase protein 1 (concanavalin A-like superfamily)
MLYFFFFAFVVMAQKKEVSVPFLPKPLVWYNQPLHFSVNKSSIVTEAGENTDMFRDPNATYNTDNAPKLLFVPDSNFVLIASIEHSFSNKWDGGALVLMADSAHWIKFCYEKDYTGARRVVSVVTSNVSDDCNSVSLDLNKVYYKMAKADNVITLYYSTDQKTWLLVRHLQINFETSLRVGFLAQSPTGQRCEVRFADIQYSSVKIKDPYLGE